MSRSEEQIQDCQGTMNFTTLLLFTDIFYLPKHKTYSNTGRSPVFLRWHNNQLQRVLYFFSELQLPSYSIRNFIFFNSFLVYRVSVLLYHACILCNRALILSIVRESYQVYRSIWGVFPHLYYRVNPFVPLITSKFISTLQVVQRVGYDNL